MEYYSALREKENPAICNNMNEPWGYLAKWNKAVTEGQILHDFTSIVWLRMRDWNGGCQGLKKGEVAVSNQQAYT